MADRRCLRRVEILNIEGLGCFKPLRRAVVASSGSKSSQIEGLGLFKSLWPTVVASGGSKSSKIEGVGTSNPLWPSLWCALGASLGNLGTLWGHFGSLWVTVGRVWVIWGHSKGTLGISLCRRIAFHKNLPKVWESCSKTHILEHYLD